MPKINAQRPAILKGMDATRRADLISAEQWRYQFNMRLKETKLTQVPRKVYKYGLAQQEPVLHIDILPSQVNAGYGKVVGLTKSTLWALGDSAGTSIASNFNTSAEFLRWASVKHGGRMYFCNPVNGVAWTDGIMYEGYSDTPRGYQLAVDNRHLLVGNFSWKGQTHRNGVAWSHLRQFSSFESSSSLEGDYSVFDEYHRDGETVDGVTGLAPLGDVTLVFTSSVIYAMKYVEGQKTYRIDPVVFDKGCGLVYGMAQAGRGVIFPDVVEKNFFLYQGPGSQAEEVGDAIKDYFFSDATYGLNPLPELAQRTYVEVDYANKEMRWVYVSAASAGDYDRAAVLSWRDMGWSIQSVEATNCFTPGLILSKKVNELSGLNSALTGSTIAQGRTTTTIPALWGTKDGMLLREEVVGDALSVLIEQPLPYLETSDILYDDLVKTKEVDGMVIHANYTNSTLLKVEVSVRNNLNASVTWQAYGTWDPASGILRCSNPRISARIFRFRFTPITTGAAAPSTKDFSSGATVLPTPGPLYSSFRLWGVAGGVFVPFETLNSVQLRGTNANGTYQNTLTGNGVYILPYENVNGVDTIYRTLTSRSNYSLSTGKTYRVTVKAAGPQQNQSGIPNQLVFSWGSATKTWTRSDITDMSAFANYTYDFVPAASTSLAFTLTSQCLGYNIPGRAFFIDRFTVVEVVGGSATILDDDFELEQVAAGFTSSLSQGGGVRGFVFSAFAEKVRMALTQVER